MIRNLIGNLIIVPFLLFQMAGGVRTAWPGMLLAGAVGLLTGYFIWS